ncbi:MAG: hypothetical protein JRD93_20610 [Deltaproteobacteria bacterium]|nr:hypothetical protein [Deltaproteobacteria bacterium]MBW2664307.1 hypothetical protein [Deltaproteobacteria bacterium]
MRDDFITALAHEVKEEVIQNYLYERRLIEEQINYLNELADHTIQLQERLYERFARTYDLLCETEFINKFIDSTGLKEAPFKNRMRTESKYKKELRFIKVHGLTDRSRFKKLLMESYRRLCTWNDKYREDYKNLEDECNAVNHNIKKFKANHDLLTILNFLKGMDVVGIEKKHFMGENFTSEEIGAVEKSLHFSSVCLEKFKLIPPPNLPKPEAVHDQLTSLANSIYDHDKNRLSDIIK